MPYIGPACFAVRKPSPLGLVLLLAVTVFPVASQAQQRDAKGKAKGKGEAAGPAALTKNQTATLENEVSLAYRLGNSAGMLEALAPLVAKLPEGQIAAVNEKLTELRLPSFGDLLADARLATYRAKNASSIPKPTAQEGALVVAALAARIDRVLEERRGQAAFQDPLPAPRTFEAYEQIFWNVHVLANRLIGTKAAAIESEQMVARLYKPFGKRVAAVDFAAKRTELETMGAELGERQLELRLQRLEMARDVLKESAVVRERILATYALDFDGDVLQASLQPSRDRPAPVYARERLKADGLLASVTESVEAGRTAAGDLLPKSRAFFEGLHWWMRGRYGRGTQMSGLMKSPESLRSAAAQVALFMPSIPPKPVDSTQVGSYSIPEVDRRHHYLWEVAPPQIQWEGNYFM